MEKKTHKTVIVLGSPRGGTSITSGILSDIGVDMGNIRKPDAQNPTGYFEDIDISRLCDRIIFDIDKGNNGFHPPENESILSRKDKFSDEIKTVLDNRSSNADSVWGWKTITSSILFDLFIEYIEHPYLIAVYRNPLDTARSIVKYTEYKSMYETLDLRQSLNVPLRYYSEINRILREYDDIPAHLITYESIIADSQSTICGISDFLEIDLNDRRLNNALKRIKDPGSMNKLKSRNRIMDTVRKCAGRVKRRLYL